MLRNLTHLIEQSNVWCIVYCLFLQVEEGSDLPEPVTPEEGRSRNLSEIEPSYQESFNEVKFYPTLDA
jgi:hypothetical protein